MPGTDGLDVIVRFHDARRLRELDRAIFSLVGQTYRPINIVLVMQRFTPDEIAVARNALAPHFHIDDAPDLTIINWEENEPSDSRSMLINRGIENARYRYLAFLDYDDVLHPDAYALLIGRLRESGAAIAFGGICASELDVFDSYYRTRDRTFPFSGADVIDLFQHNFCPIHSFVIDRTAVARHNLFFEPQMSRNEDYDFLIRICAQYRSDFSLVRTHIGTYYQKSDGSNTVVTANETSVGRISAWDDACYFIEGRRRTTLVSADVQCMLGRKPVPDLTIRGLLDQYRTK